MIAWLAAIIAIVAMVAVIAAVADRPKGRVGRTETDSRSAPRDRNPPGTPRQAIEQLIAAHASRSYREMESLMVAGRAADAARTLAAIDEFLLANRLLCEHVRDRFGPGMAQLIDQSHIAGNLDVFSPYVELVDEEVNGDEAHVSFTVDGRLPLKRTRLVRVDGQWKYDPGDGYATNLPDAFRRMAEGLRLVLDGLKRGQPAAERILEKPEVLVEEVRVRLIPGVAMLKPTTAPASGPRD